MALPPFYFAFSSLVSESLAVGSLALGARWLAFGARSPEADAFGFGAG
jgi:hypothetical protein